MIVELLKVRVAPEVQENFLLKDAEVWTQALAGYPGFLDKEIWLNPNEPTEVILIIRWASREQWKSIPLEVLEIIEQQFTHQLGNTYQIIESSEYQVNGTPPF